MRPGVDTGRPVAGSQTAEIDSDELAGDLGRTNRRLASPAG